MKLLPVLIAAVALAAVGPASAAVTQPAQPKSGPAAATTRTRGWRVSSGGSGTDAWYVFEPVEPRPARRRSRSSCTATTSSPATTRCTSSSGTRCARARRHLPALADRRRDAVPGPVRHRAVHRRRRSTASTARSRTCGPSRQRVQPQLRQTSYFGFSFGGIITANMANRYQALRPAEAAGDLPRRPARRRPHRRPTSRRSTTRLRGIPSTVKLECHSGRRRRHRRSRARRTRAATRCSRSSAHIPKRNKDLVLTHTDDARQPRALGAHGVCAARQGRAPTPTTGTSAGRCGTRCAAAR